MSALRPHIAAARANERAAQELQDWLEHRVEAVPGAEAEIEHWRNVRSFYRRAADILQAEQDREYREGACIP